MRLLSVLFLSTTEYALSERGGSMAVMQKNARKERSLSGSVLIGIVISLVCCLLLSMVVTVLVDSRKVQENSVVYASFFVLLISSFVGSLLAGMRAGEKMALVCGAVAGGVTLCLVGVTVAVFGAAFDGVPIALAAVVVGGVLGCILSAGKGRRGKKLFR